MGTSPPAAAFYVGFRALRAAARELPEDFIERLEPGIDEPVRSSLQRGIRVLRLFHRSLDWSVGILILGTVTILGSIVVTNLTDTTGQGMWAIAAGFFLWISGAVLALGVYALTVVRRTDVSRVLSFAHAMETSSLARDFA